jgi:hypothetical protein
MAQLSPRMAAVAAAAAAVEVVLAVTTGVAMKLG